MSSKNNTKKKAMSANALARRQEDLSRRKFLCRAGLALVAPTILPASVLGTEVRPAPSERITVGIIGFGWYGEVNTDGFLRQPECQVVAVCDVDQRHLKRGIQHVNEHYGNTDCKAYNDFRELCARRDIDVVVISVPDHWHALIAVEAARQGKDIYGEKPLARTISEQRAIVRAVQQHGRV
ncbi:MAG: Gfo/Idh/MocA family oxidoreductase [Verrucomicrobiae bacterium]|nr:Gfo/Idh/MocA family oxidoreductase [Verrucomicrobiae bacterium]MDW7979108.1 Gfo/Idh/MocA family oxidoreductase [Verrucomicrobiales bacterium]